MILYDSVYLHCIMGGTNLHNPPPPPPWGFEPQGWSGSPVTKHFVFWEARLTGSVGVRVLTQTGQETLDSR